MEGLNQKELDNKIEQARQAFKQWGAYPLNKRKLFLKRLKEAIYNDRNTIIRLIMEESGRVKFTAEGAIFEVLNTFGIVKQAQEILGNKLTFSSKNISYKTKKCYLIYQPIGVVAILAPSNNSFLESLQQAIQALIMGNVVILKPSERSPGLSLKIEEIIKEAGFPEGVISVIHGGGDVGRALAEAPGVDKIVAFGTRITGQKILTSAAMTIKPLMLGLGGNEAAIVLEDCLLDRTVEGIVYGAFCNAGQTCSCIRRVIVIKNIAEEFLKKLIARIERLHFGALEEDENDLGIIKLSADVKALQQAITEAGYQGAQVITGKIREESPCRIAPFLITQVTPDMRIMQEEFMAPYLCYYVADTVEEAIAVANNSIYGLTASVWSSDSNKAEKIARLLSAGTIWVNDSQFYHYEFPYGGIKQSGFGKITGREGLLEYVYKKLICVERSPGLGFPWFPYTSKKVYFLDTMLKIKHDPLVSNKMKNFIKLIKIILWNK